MLWACGGDTTPAEAPGAIYDEAQVPAYELPDPFERLDGTPVDDAAAWRNDRRPELVRLFEEQVYGSAPRRPDAVPFSVVDVDETALGGRAVRKEVDVWFGAEPEGPSMRLLLFIPKTSQPAPAFLALNFGGNQSVHPDPAITLDAGWFRNDADRGYVDHHATEATRGVAADRWPVERIVERGYALVTAYYGDIAPDDEARFEDERPALEESAGPEGNGSYDWGAIAVWAWGMSRALDYLDEEDAIDAARVAALGHSRLGKAALWAGATDERFALVVSNNSGCGGAALSRRRFGESVERINRAFPHWFTPRFDDFSANEDALDVDQHLLIALVAPRPVYVASAVEDQWADPRGEFLAAYHADPVYALLGVPGLEADDDAMPAVGEPRASGAIGYHVREGVHDVTDYDWAQYLDFADRHLD